jgi:hypothetical protein
MACRFFPLVADTGLLPFADFSTDTIRLQAAAGYSIEHLKHESQELPVFGDLLEFDELNIDRFTVGSS